MWEEGNNQCAYHSRETLEPPKGYCCNEEGPQWVLDHHDSVFNLSVLARTEDNAITLRSDFMVSVMGVVVGGVCVQGGRRGGGAIPIDFMISLKLLD